MFDDVLFFEMQRNKIKSLSFTQAWKVCAKAMPNLSFYKGIEILTRQFTYHLLSAIEDLEDKTLIEVTRRGTGRFAKILQFKLTNRGNEELSRIVFTHQERMGE
jgi:hypothetical protein